MPRYNGELDTDRLPHSPPQKATIKRPLLLSAGKLEVEAAGLGDHDVLCGRGVPFHQHIGNIRWRRIVNANKEVYSQHKTNTHKFFMALSIVVAIERQGGRFIRLHMEKKNGNVVTFIPIDRKHAIEKTKQALREKPKETFCRKRKTKRRTGIERDDENDVLLDENHEDGYDDYDYDDDDVLPINHHAATQPLTGFSGLLSSFISVLGDDPMTTTAHPINATCDYEAHHHPSVFRGIYVQC